jgi:hypothetical protein
MGNGRLGFYANPTWLTKEKYELLDIWFTSLITLIWADSTYCLIPRKMLMGENALFVYMPVSVWSTELWEYEKLIDKY